ncbi:MAG: hypothetical protein U9M89_00495 [Patescibacteria group bacterium]|nr:hypothetical protein [Patescibacteria group bacterium]
MNKKKVVICSSAKFYDQAQEWKNKLKSEGFDVIRTIQSIDENSISQYEATHKEHYSKMAKCDVVFVLNVKKNGVEGYIGASVFAEIAFAIGLNLVLNKNIQIWLLNPLAKESSYLDELTKWEKLGWIKQFTDQKVAIR